MEHHKIAGDTMKYYTTKQVAEMLEYEPDTIRIWCQQGKYPHAKKEGKWMIPQCCIDGHDPEEESARVPAEPSKLEKLKREKQELQEEIELKKVRAEHEQWAKRESDLLAAEALQEAHETTFKAEMKKTEAELNRTRKEQSDEWTKIYKAREDIQSKYRIMAEEEKSHQERIAELNKTEQRLSAVVRSKEYGDAKYYAEQYHILEGRIADIPVKLTTRYFPKNHSGYIPKPEAGQPEPKVKDTKPLMPPNWVGWLVGAIAIALIVWAIFA